MGKPRAPLPPPGIAQIITDNRITAKEAEAMLAWAFDQVHIAAMLVGECYRLENAK